MKCLQERALRKIFNFFLKKFNRHGVRRYATFDEPLTLNLTMSLRPFLNHKYLLLATRLVQWPAPTIVHSIMVHIIRVSDGTLIMDLFVKNAISIITVVVYWQKGESLNFHNFDNNIFTSNIFIISANPFQNYLTWNVRSII